MIGAAVGAAVRQLPRGRNRVAALLQSRVGRTVLGRDATGLQRSFDLRDLLQAQWFCGVEVGLSPEALAFVKPGDWALDVGANVGIVTGQLCRAVGASGRVSSLEPLPDNLEKLRDLKVLNALTQLDLQPVAAGAASSRETIHLPPKGNSGWGSFSATWLDSGTLEVDVRPLDELVPELSNPDHSKVAFIKIDVEGYEFEVIEGAARVLQEHRPTVLMEFNDPLLRDRGRSSQDLMEVCLEAAYAPTNPDALSSDWLEGAVRDVVLRPS